MANPFYIPQGPSLGERVAQPLTELMRIRQVGELGQEHNRLAGEDIALRSKGLDLEAQKLTETQNKRESDTPRSRMPFDANSKQALSMAIDKLDPLNVLKDIKKEFDFFESIGADRGHVYANYGQDAWPETQKTIVNLFRQKALDPETPRAYREWYTEKADQVEKDKTGKTIDMFFPQVAREYELQDAELDVKKKLGAADVQKYEFAQKQGYKGSLVQFLKETEQAGRSAYFSPVQTSTGLMNYDHRTGTWQPMLGPDNKPLVSPVADPSLAAAKEFNTKMADELVKERKDVVGAVTSLDNIKQAKALLNSGIITGTGAQWLTNMGSFLSSRLGFTALEDPVMNTQAFAATMGNQVGQIIKQFGSGTGLSDADREYAEKIVGGRITLNEGAIRKLIDINEKAFTNVIKRFNEKADQATQKQGKEAFPYDLRVNYDFGDKGKLPDGLSEEDLNFNMQKYGKSRQEVIDQFNKVKGAK